MPKFDTFNKIVIILLTIVPIRENRTFRTLGQPLLKGNQVTEKRRRKTLLIGAISFRLQRPRAVHALRSDQLFITIQL